MLWWVEGALDVAESTLQDFFGLTRPTWLPASYALLPNPCPGCGDLKGCVKSKDAARVLAAITPDCRKAVEEG